METMATSRNPKMNRLARSLNQTFKRKQPSVQEEYTRDPEDVAARESANEPILPPPASTNICIWLCAISCSIFAIIVILTGLIVLLGFLIFHPRLPSFTVKEATLNTLLLDSSFVLSSQTTILLHIRNPNAKVAVDYESLRFELQFEKHALSNLTFSPFSQQTKNSTDWLFVMAASAVQLQPIEGEHLSYSIQSNSVTYDFVGTVRTKAKFGSITSIRYWLHIKCNLEFNSPSPVNNGSLVSSSCHSWK
jgi:hypothetical protein